MAVNWPVSGLAHTRTHRLIASRWPTVGVFDDLVSAADAEAAMELEGATNDRLTGARGRLKAIPADDIAIGPGASIVMAAFLHGDAGRFNGAALGAWYASLDLPTAIAETVHHHDRRLRASAGAFPTLIQMRELISSPMADLIDLRRGAGQAPELYDPGDYARSQPFGEEVRRHGMDGIWFDSVRATGQNVVIYRPHLLVPVAQADHFEYAWDRSGAVEVKRLTSV